jgi:hypothetical protein
MSDRVRIIMGGLPRSGTSLLGQYVDQVGLLTGIHESAFFLNPLWHVQAAVAKNPEKLAQRLGLPADDVQRVVLSATDQVAAFDGLMDRMTGPDQSGRGWLEKTPRNCEVYSRLAAASPDLAYVSVIRHGLDAVTSRISTHPTKGAEYWCSIQRYVDSMTAILAFSHARHVVVRYEDLVNDPEGTVRSIHAWGGVPIPAHTHVAWTPLSSDLGLAQRQPHLTSQIDSTRVGRWAGPEHAARVAAFLKNSDARRLLEESGYAASGYSGPLG